MKTDTPIYTLLGADPEFLYRLTDGIEVHGPYLFEALDVKGLERRTDGVLLPQREDEGIWVIEFQARRDPLIYHRLVQEIGLVGERHARRTVRGFVLFAEAALDPRTEPWHSLMAGCERAAAARLSARGAASDGAGGARPPVARGLSALSGGRPRALAPPPSTVN